MTADWSRALWAVEDGTRRSVFFMNPPYSRCREFMAKAALETHNGHTIVCLVPARVDTRWFHAHVYDASTRHWYPGVEVRFVQGRLKFGCTGKPQKSAPFPSLVIVFRPQVI